MAELPNQPLYSEGSLLNGQTSNTVSPLGTFTDRFSPERWLTTVGVSSEVTRGKLRRLPFLDAKYTSDAQAANVDGLGNPIAPGYEGGRAQVNFGGRSDLAIVTR